MGRTSNAKERLMTAVGELIWVGSYGGTTIDDICEKAGVKKGSFYHFFKSKADLAISAIDAEWQIRRGELDRMFSPVMNPLERLRMGARWLFTYQAQIKERFGRVLGCPLFSLGAEISTQEVGLQQKIEEVLNYKRTYLESAIRDAHREGLINAPDPAAKARMLFTYYQGLLTEARIRNDLEMLKEAERGTLDLLGLTEAPAQAA